MRNRSALTALKLDGKIKTRDRKRSLTLLKVKRLEKEAERLGITVPELKRRRAHDIQKKCRGQQSRKKLRVIPGASSIAA